MTLPKEPYGFSVVIPAYNEEGAILETISQLNATLKTEMPHEIVVVNDGSTDRTGEILSQNPFPNVNIVHHGHNKGYGASLKTGIRRSKYPVVVITDADGTYPNHRILELIGELQSNGMVVGARVGKNVRIPLIRRPAKWCINQLANYLSGVKIPDLNSGLRIFDKETLLKYIHILPNGFSFTTTISLAMLTCGEEVKYVPIEYAARVGKSKIKPIRDTLNFIQLIIRTVLLFDPLRVFLPLFFLLLLSSAGVFFYSWFYMSKILDTTVTILAMSAIQMLAIGMIADMINRRLQK